MHDIRRAVKFQVPEVIGQGHNVT